jgi:hypothetical protein
MNPSEEPAIDPASIDPLDATFRQEVKRLHRINLYGRWVAVGLLWVTVGSLSLWGLRYPISLVLDYFTWSAVRYGLIFHRLPAIGLLVCAFFTLSLLFRQIRHWLFGITQPERQRLETRVCQIRLQGESHPLWKFVCRKT